MANDKDKAVPPSLKPDEIIRSDIPHVVSFNERTGKATSAAGGAKSRENGNQAEATESAKDKAPEKDATLVIPHNIPPLADRREKGASAAVSEVDIQKARLGYSDENIFEVMPRNAVVDAQVEGQEHRLAADRIVKAPKAPSAVVDESALPAETTRRLDNMAADVNRVLRDVRLEMAPVAPGNDTESIGLLEAFQNTKVDNPRDDPQRDRTVVTDSQSAMQSLLLTMPAGTSETAPTIAKFPSHTVGGNLQAVEAPPADASTRASMISRTEFFDNVQRAPAAQSSVEEPGVRTDGYEHKLPEAGSVAAIDKPEFATAVPAATTAAIAKLDANALLKLSLDAETVVRLNQEQAQSQEINQKLEAIQKRLSQSKSGR